MSIMLSEEVVLLCRYAEGVSLMKAREMLWNDAQDCFKLGKCDNPVEADLVALRRLFSLVMQVLSWLYKCVRVLEHLIEHTRTVHE